MTLKPKKMTKITPKHEKDQNTLRTKEDCNALITLKMTKISLKT